MIECSFDHVKITYEEKTLNDCPLCKILDEIDNEIKTRTRSYEFEADELKKKLESIEKICAS